jgi:hypothetical protein
VVAALRAAVPGSTFAVERTGGMHYEPHYSPLFEDDPGASVAPVEKLLSEDCGHEAEPVLKLLVRHGRWEPDAFLELARAAAGHLAEVTRSSPSSLLEISGLGVSKASTLARCCAERGINPEEVVAFAVQLRDRGEGLEEAVEGLTGLMVTFELELSDLGREVSVTAPADALPASELPTSGS